LNRSSCAPSFLTALFVSVILTGAASASVSSDGLWHTVTADEALAIDSGQRVLFPKAFRLFRLDLAAFRDLARKAPLELTLGADEASPVILLPMPDGSFARFRLQESPIMEVRLAARLPEVKTYRAQGLDDRAATARLDLTPEGFHGFILSPAGAVYIDPYARGNTQHYMSYWRRDYARSETIPPFRCGVAEIHHSDSTDAKQVVSQGTPTALVASGATLRTYRLALAGTGEYTAFHGGTVAGAQAGMVTTMNRVNGIFEKDVAVRMTMIDNTAIVFTDPMTDPYADDDPFEDIDTNQTVIDNAIGSANYDIGHLFSTEGGGLASLQSVCFDGGKANGVTGTPSPVSDAFDVDYVAHEMGHQFGAEHTFAGSAGACSGNGWPPSAFEPGSGSTIMGYAGICGAQDLQPHSDPYFHIRSIDEILAFTTGDGDSCAAQTATGNDAPTVNAGAAISIPKSTPFYLTGSALDLNDDPLTYCWEQFNAGSPAIFRSFNPISSPIRTFPKLSDLLANTTTIGEALPSTARTMNFRLTARDNRAGGGGVNDGATIVTVATSGPFLVTAPNTAVTWNGGSSQNVTWNVAGTTSAPVSCANVKIVLSTDGGNTFPTTLLASTANDGTEATPIPNIASTTARVRVECATSPFFDISNTNFTIAQQVDGVVATATSATNVGVTWSSVPGAVSYQIHRKAAGGSFTLLDTSATTNYTDTTATAGNAYLYAVKWVDGSAVVSALSNPDIATTFFFTDPTLVAGATAVKTVHITELRTAIGAVRTLAGLGTFSYTDPTLTGGVTFIKLAHLTELRTALDAALTALVLPAASYTDPSPIAQTTVIKAVHVEELRDGVQ
jgi:Metallo-peptidase family M12B Reprolysin-like